MQRDAARQQVVGGVDRGEAGRQIGIGLRFSFLLGTLRSVSLVDCIG